MELPKNITQIGETDKNSKIYMEDYVVSYIKQQSRKAAGKQMGVALYGKQNKEENMSYYFIYGACKVNYISKEVRHLSGAQLQEAERIRKSNFEEYLFLGYCILDGEPVEGIHLYENEICRYIKGYACFYEKNDSMLSFMVENREKEYTPEQVSCIKYEEVKDRQQERKRLFEENKGIVSKKPVEKPEGENNFFPVAAVLMLAVLGVAAAGYSNPGELQARLNAGLNTLQAWFQQEEEEVLPAAAEHVETLVAESQLTEAIQKENDVVPTEAPVTAAPVPTATPEPVPVSTPAPTPIPTPEPTAVEEPVAAVPQEYTIQIGDTLIQICRNRYGDEGMVKDVCAMNGISNPNNIQVGQKILLP
ncbi:MAG: LysM peptidoglycan-binding domain-containing protein [Lachnospiraceae bacterium]|nr:LysM peptidoglycan-binding domain-containing protein [Lachnospiraceae bacterium]